jgi:hypothetical protein
LIISFKSIIKSVTFLHLLSEVMMSMRWPPRVEGDVTELSEFQMANMGNTEFVVGQKFPSIQVFRKCS